MWISSLLLLSGISLSFASPAPASQTLSARQSQSTACGAIVNNLDTDVFNASLAYECLTSVPFDAGVATSFLKYYRDTLQFQSTLTYLKNPPNSYQQPGVDLMGGLDALQKGIDDRIFPNQYEFEAALQSLLYASHDGHISLEAGVLAVFTFSSPLDVVSLSRDGSELPKVYLVQDLSDSDFFTGYQPSAIKTINGEDTVTYLTKFAGRQSVGMVEPHGDWNQMMRSASQDIQGYLNTFSGATFYPGPTVEFKLENGTVIKDYFLAIYNSQGNTGPLQTGGDFYNYFVLGLLPASYDPDLWVNNSKNLSAPISSAAASSTVPSTPDATSISTSAPTSTETTSASTATCETWDNFAYPDCADVSQPDLGTFGGGFVSGYFLQNTKTGVLSIPSFDLMEDAVDDFDSTIVDFITKAKSAGMKKIVIDLQSNQGGKALLAIDAFKHFFPNIDPYAASRLRAHPAAYQMGQAISELFTVFNTSSDEYRLLAPTEFVALNRINANTGRLFGSWDEFFGPVAAGGDQFTTLQRYNLGDPIFTSEAVQDSGNNFTVFGYGTNGAAINSAISQPPYAAEDIILLTDAICDSSCAMFVEMMHHEAGVKVVTAGGRPVPGPMQSAAGARGARLYYTDTLDANIELAQLLYQAISSPNATFLPNRTEALQVYVLAASINLRDQIRKDQTIPLQFAYEAADCRIWYTPQTVYNYTALWQYAADAIWGTNKMLCVEGSTGFATAKGKSDWTGPTNSSLGTTSATDILGHLTTLNTSSIPFLTRNSSGIDDAAPAKTAAKLTQCLDDGDCKKFVKHACTIVKACNDDGKVATQKVCLPRCKTTSKVNALCGDKGKCVRTLDVCDAKGVCKKEGASTTTKKANGVPTTTPIAPICSPSVDQCKTGLSSLAKSGSNTKKQTSQGNLKE
ncbi:hypothetical protein BGZ60DRAFT_456892 [Tricladium varicosporioides]|nr:hypothetical protein BGZ60DRAFT_456892 [Hymenoscyphus varicosporioides]